MLPNYYENRILQAVAPLLRPASWWLSSALICFASANLAAQNEMPAVTGPDVGEAAEVGGSAVPAEILAAKTLEEVKALRQKLQKHREALAQRVSEAADSSDEQRDALNYWHNVSQTYLFTATRTSELEQALQRSEQLVRMAEHDDALIVLKLLQQQYQSLLEEFLAGEHLYDAKRSAETARMDLHMYQMMKHVHATGPEAQRAQEAFERGESSLQSGEFKLAVQRWQDATVGFNQKAFAEVLRGFKLAGDTATRRADERLQAVRQEVVALVEDHFVTIPGGEFTMGSQQRGGDEILTRRVSVQQFQLGKTEVTFKLWDLCVEVRTCPRRPADEQWGRGERPAINVSYNDITESFIPWLKMMTGKQYRLPTEAEWEYATGAHRLGTRYSWGEQIDCTLAQFDQGFGSECSTAGNSSRRGTAPVMSYPPNLFGVYDMHGNVWEWVQDCYARSYERAPVDGSSVESAPCQAGTLRGGAWDSGKEALVATNRFYFPRSERRNNFGFRLVEMD